MFVLCRSNSDYLFRYNHPRFRFYDSGLFDSHICEYLCKIMLFYAVLLPEGRSYDTEKELLSRSVLIFPLDTKSHPISPKTCDYQGRL